MNWTARTWCGFDLETTGVDPERDRIVSAAGVTRWLADPGVEIPAGATGIHGITTEAARTAGRPAAEVVTEITAALIAAAEAGLPLVVMNAPFDLTMAEREAERYGVASLFSSAVPLVLDPRILDRRADRYRPGGRTLGNLCRTYKVAHGGAHDAAADAVAACAVTAAVARTHPWLADIPLEELHELQVRWAADQQADLREHFATTPGKTHRAASVRTDWPVLPAMPGVVL